ncbi:MAG TPA: hypothetical protein VF017_00995 [Thermoanaerobaculia bacterium]|nr:hypothetical protein [Thermoanaerobaculia bacterium]
MLDAEPPVVVNTTPVVALSVLEHLDLLYLLFGPVLIPPAVQREVEAGGKARPGATELSAAPWIKVTPLKDPSRA